MMRAIFNDIAQRIITLDKWEQRKNLSKRLKRIDLKSGSKVLDFGCGTGLFSRVFKKQNFEYWGYDIDEGFIAYASNLYKNCQFTTSKKIIANESPYDLILINCCFHHISDKFISLELERLKSLLNRRGVLLLIDILFDENHATFLRRLFMKLERGKHVRTIEGYKNLLKEHFIIDMVEIERSYIFSFNHKLNSLYNDLVVFQNSLRPS